MTYKHFFSYACGPRTSLEEAATGLTTFLKGLAAKDLTPVKVYVALSSEYAMDLATWQEDFAEGLKKILGERIPAITAVGQPPVDGSPLLAEIWCVDNDMACRFLQIEKQPYVLIEQNGVTELWSSGFVADTAKSAFERLTALLEKTRFTYDDIFRQWNYVGNILEENLIEGKRIQNYQHFNDIRAFYYQRKQDRSQYPAATGIGMDTPGFCVDIVAIKTVPGLEKRNFPMKSPVQKDAYRYDDRLLVGESVVLPAKNAPLFERGRRFTSNDYGIAMISGTASIKGEETIDQNDICRQTRNTLRFIRDLLKDYPQAHCQRARLYVKRGQDPDAAVRIFKESFPEDCVCTAVWADVCRNNLLIEIETDWEL